MARSPRGRCMSCERYTTLMYIDMCRSCYDTENEQHAADRFSSEVISTAVTAARDWWHGDDAPSEDRVEAIYQNGRLQELLDEAFREGFSRGVYARPGIERAIEEEHERFRVERVR